MAGIGDGTVTQFGRGDDLRPAVVVEILDSGESRFLNTRQLPSLAPVDELLARLEEMPERVLDTRSLKDLVVAEAAAEPESPWRYVSDQVMGGVAEGGAEVGDAGANGGVGGFCVQAGRGQQQGQCGEAANEQHEEAPHGGHQLGRDGLAVEPDRHHGVRMDQAVERGPKGLEREQCPEALDRTARGTRHSAEDHETHQHQERQCLPELEIGRAISGGGEDTDRLKSRMMAKSRELNVDLSVQNMVAHQIGRASCRERV